MSKVVGVANRRPPMTARASAAFCSSPAPPIAIGIMPTIIAPAVISTGRMRVRPASIAARNADLPASCPLDLDTEAFIVSQSGPEEGGGATLFLVWHDLGKGDARVVVDGDVDV